MEHEYVVQTISPKGQSRGGLLYHYILLINATKAPLHLILTDDLIR